MKPLPLFAGMPDAEPSQTPAPAPPSLPGRSPEQPWRVGDKVTVRQWGYPSQRYVTTIAKEGKRPETADRRAWQRKGSGAWERYGHRSTGAEMVAWQPGDEERIQRDALREARGVATDRLTAANRAERRAREEAEEHRAECVRLDSEIAALEATIATLTAEAT